MADLQLCGKWMPRAGTTCARTLLHGGACATAEAMARQRERTAARERPYDPIARHRWNQTYKLSRYGITSARFAEMLEGQGHACAMCEEPFQEGQKVCVDHDHACCPDERSSCGRCVRGLLCHPCNTSLGHIERKGDIARAYLNRVKLRQAA